jgi:hypothetical protein
MATPCLKDATWERMIRAVEKVKERCARSVDALELAGVPHAIIGGHAVANWVASVDEGAVRNTRDVDILIRRSDLDATKLAMEAAGFKFDRVYGVDLFLDGPDCKPSECVHLLYAGEKVKETDLLPSPDVSESERGAEFQVLSLEPLVRMKLVSFRRKDQVHLQDMTRLGLINETWPDRFPPELASRLREIIADPDG